MIQANEIRVGNLIKSGRIIVPVDARTIFDIWDSSKKYDPIELTPDLLLKAGFRRNDGGFGRVCFNIGTNPVTSDWVMTVVYNSIENYFFYLNAYHSIKYLHQLQNLFFCLTGEELTL